GAPGAPAPPASAVAAKEDSIIQVDPEDHQDHERNQAVGGIEEVTAGPFQKMVRQESEQQAAHQGRAVGNLGVTQNEQRGKGRQGECQQEVQVVEDGEVGGARGEQLDQEV